MRAVNPIMIAVARESRGLTQGQLAAQLGMTQSKISKYEHGMLTVPPGDALLMARVLEYHPELFFQTSRMYALGSSYVFNRKYKSAPASLQRKLQARANVVRLQIERLLEAAEIEHRNLFSEPRLSALDGTPEEIAKQVRDAWRVPAGPIPDLTALVEDAGGIVVEFDFETPTIDAVHFWLPALPPMFFINTQASADRRRFDLGHELGHAVMHRFASEHAEDEANRFAAEFLMPKHDILPFLEGATLESLARLKGYWRVSIQALTRRARDLGTISERKYRALFTQLSARGHRREEPFPIAPEHPKVVDNLMALHREQLLYTDEEMRKLIFTPSLAALAGGPQPNVSAQLHLHHPANAGARARDSEPKGSRPVPRPATSAAREAANSDVVQERGAHRGTKLPWILRGMRPRSGA